VGGRVTYLPGGDVPEMPAGEVTEHDAPRVLAHTWDEDLLRWEVRPADDGAVLVLTHISTTASRRRATAPAGTSASTRSRPRSMA
jgi:hypothetical protein